MRSVTLALYSYDLHVNSEALQWVGPAVHACSETALGCTMREAGRKSLGCFACFANRLASATNVLTI
jgi:hypothetical protein